MDTSDSEKVGAATDAAKAKVIELDKEIAKLSGTFGAMAKLWDASSKEMGAGLSGTKAVAAGLGVVLNQAFAVEKLVEFAAKSVETAAKIGEISEATGVAAQDLSVMNHAAELNGASLDKVAAGLNGMGDVMTKALGGNAAATKSFADLGISVQELRTRSPRDLMLEVANALDGIKDPAERAAAAQGVLGSSAATLLPTLQSLAGDGFAKMADEADKMGLIVSGPAAESAKQFQQNWAQLTGSLMGVVNTLMTALVPAINAVIGAFAESGNSGWMAWLNPIRLVELAIKGVSGVIVGLVGLLTAWGTQAKMVVKDVGDVMAAVAKHDWSGALKIMETSDSRRSEQWNKDMNSLVTKEEGIFLPDTGHVEARNRPPSMTAARSAHGR